MTRKQFGSVPWTHLYTEQKPGIGLFHISPLTRALGSAHYEQVILFDLQAVSTQRVKCFIGWVERTTAAATQGVKGSEKGFEISQSGNAKKDKDPLE